jgi:hypothetical protein
VSRSISLDARKSIYAEQTGEVWVFLVTITHEDLVEPMLFSSDPTERLSDDPLQYGTVSRGNAYAYLPMTVTLPDDSDGTAPTIKLSLDNVLRDTVPLLRSVSTPPSVTAEMVLASSPDTVEASFPAFDLIDANYDSGQVTVDLTVDALSTEPYPADTFTPSGFGGLF